GRIIISHIDIREIIIVNTFLTAIWYDQSEWPHLLEHLVFEGTAAYPEPGTWERQIRHWGGSSNAETDLHQTVYQINIYGPHAPHAVAALHELAQDALLDDVSLARAQRTVHRELGSDASALQRGLYAHGISQSGTDKIREALGVECPGMERVDSADRAGLLELYRRYYVAGNMTLVAVGRFDAAELLAQVEATFGALPDAPPPQRRSWTVGLPTAPITVQSTLAPMLGSEATVQMAFPAAGYLSADFPVLMVISEYLNRFLYDRLRRQAGWSYTPSTGWTTYPQTGYFYLSTDVAPANTEAVAAALREDLTELAHEGLSPETVEELKRGLLLGYAQGNETNGDMADYFVSLLAELDVYGRFLNFEDRLEAVTASQLQEVAARILRPDNAITAFNAPTLTYGAALLGAGLLLLSLGVILWGLRRKNRAVLRQFLTQGGRRAFGRVRPLIERKGGAWNAQKNEASP
ncbi:MAG: insulinase family protein, partial [Candidatus Competibacteraceae bacterium]|nr:insulinase family protein [Candidatus Competibacteraceae bacterium]